VPEPSRRRAAEVEDLMTLLKRNVGEKRPGVRIPRNGVFMTSTSRYRPLTSAPSTARRSDLAS
jgi:hypothetical protein